MSGLKVGSVVVVVGERGVELLALSAPNNGPYFKFQVIISGLKNGAITYLSIARFFTIYLPDVLQKRCKCKQMNVGC